MTRVHDVIEFVKEKYSGRGESLKVHGVISMDVHYNDDQTGVSHVVYGVEFSDYTGVFEVEVYDFPVNGFVVRLTSLKKTADLFRLPPPIKKKKKEEEEEIQPRTNDGYCLWTFIAQELARRSIDQPTNRPTNRQTDQPSSIKPFIYYDGCVEGAGRDPSLPQ